MGAVDANKTVDPFSSKLYTSGCKKGCLKVVGIRMVRKVAKVVIIYSYKPLYQS
jgi:hypothetical protein